MKKIKFACIFSFFVIYGTRHLSTRFFMHIISLCTRSSFVSRSDKYNDSLSTILKRTNGTPKTPASAAMVCESRYRAKRKPSHDAYFFLTKCIFLVYVRKLLYLCSGFQKHPSQSGRLLQRKNSKASKPKVLHSNLETQARKGSKVFSL